MMETTVQVRRMGLARRLLSMVLLVIAAVIPVGCIQDAVLIPVSIIEGRVIPTGVSNPPPTTSPGSVILTVNTTVPTVGVRLNVVGSGTNVSLNDPIGPLPGSSDFTFASVTGDFELLTNRRGQVRVVARGINYDLGWGDVFIPEFGIRVSSSNCDSVTLPFQSPLRLDTLVHLVVKAPRRAVFVVFAEDFTIRGVPVRSVRVLIDQFTAPTDGFNLPDDGSLVPQTDHAGDDVVSQDLAAGDGVFTRVLTLDPGEHFYAFVVNNDDKLRRDPYEEFSDVNDPRVKGVRRSGILVK